eukprot:jgi/Ulvmu1/10355/UM061_0038.1
MLRRQTVESPDKPARLGDSACSKADVQRNLTTASDHSTTPAAIHTTASVAVVLCRAACCVLRPRQWSAQARASAATQHAATARDAGMESGRRQQRMHLHWHCTAPGAIRPSPRCGARKRIPDAARASECASAVILYSPLDAGAGVRHACGQTPLTWRSTL